MSLGKGSLPDAYLTPQVACSQVACSQVLSGTGMNSHTNTRVLTRAQRRVRGSLTCRFPGTCVHALRSIEVRVHTHTEA